jgi:hypothetical protein
MKTIDKPSLWMALAAFAVLLAFGIKTALDIRMKNSCVVEGTRYYSGETVPCGRGDRCNHCSCSEGRIWSTMMGCAELAEPPPAWLKKTPRASKKLLTPQ